MSEKNRKTVYLTKQTESNLNLCTNSNTFTGQIEELVNNYLILDSEHDRLKSHAKNLEEEIIWYRKYFTNKRINKALEEELTKSDLDTLDIEISLFKERVKS